MKIDKNFEGLKRIENGDYVIEGDLVSEDSIEVELDDRLVVTGSIVAQSYIEAGWGIKAGGGIEAGWGINAGRVIEAGWGIKAKTFIHTKKRIFAGTSVCCTNKDCEKTIRCAELRGGEIAYGDLEIVVPEGGEGNV